MAQTQIDQVQTVFSVIDKTAKPFNDIAGGLSGLAQKVASVTGLLGGLSAAIAGVGAAVSLARVVDLNGQLEKTTNTIAGFLQALDYSKDYNQGLVMAAGVLRQIEVSAAALPGTAQDYITVFQAGLPEVSKAIGGTLQDMTRFTNQYAAIANTLQVESSQAARDLKLMLADGQGQAGAQVQTFSRLLTFMKLVPGYADLSSESFNKMTQEARGALLQQTLQSEAFKSMMDQAGSSYDAMSGALEANVNFLIREGGKPFFDRVKTALGTINSLIMDAEGGMTPFGNAILRVGQGISGILGDAMLKVVGLIEVAARKFEEFAGSRAFKDMLSFADSIGGALGAMADASGVTGEETAQAGAQAHAGGMAALLTVGMAPVLAQGAGQLLAMVGSAIALMFGQVELVPIIHGVIGPAVGALLTPLFMVASLLSGALAAGIVNVITRIEETRPTWGRLIQIAQALATPLGSAIRGINTMSDAIGDLFIGIWPGVVDLIAAVAAPLGVFIDGVITIGNNILTQLRPTLVTLWQTVSKAAQAIAGPLYSALMLLVRVALWVGDVFGSTLVQNIQNFATAVSYAVKGVMQFASAVSKVAAFLGLKLPDAPSFGGSSEPGYFSKLFAGLGAASDDAAAEGSGAAGGRGAGAKERGGGKTVQDFRYSRFDITQKFEEGFDPDRIAVAFSNDLGKIGEQRLQSGFEPLFAVG